MAGRRINKRTRTAAVPSLLACVVEERGDEGAVLEEGVAGGDVLKVALFEERVLEHHGAHFQVHESASEHRNRCGSAGRIRIRIKLYHHVKNTQKTHYFNKVKQSTNILKV